MSTRPRLPGRESPLRNSFSPLLVLAAVCLPLLGCGDSGPPPERAGQEFLTVVTSSGRQQVIPAGELIDSETGEPVAEKVLAIDRRTGRRKWVSVEELLRHPPAMARYVPLTKTDAGD